MRIVTLILGVLLLFCMFSKKEVKVNGENASLSMTPAKVSNSFESPTEEKKLSSFSKLAHLPEILKESSGIEIASKGRFWSFNDGKGEVELYQFDTLGTLTQTLQIKNAKNIDWEDMTQDAKGHLYIGDFGNNDNDRKDQVIYKVTVPKGSGARVATTAEKIQFSFPEQTQFPPPKPERFFDIESVFSKGDWLYLLTRDRSKPFIGKTRLYRLPNKEGQYKLEYLDEFLTDDNKDSGQITGADISPDHSSLVLVSSKTLWVFRDISGDRFFERKPSRISLPFVWDWEAVVFEDECTLYLANENKSDEPATLSKINICD